MVVPKYISSMMPRSPGRNFISKSICKNKVWIGPKMRDDTCYQVSVFGCHTRTSIGHSTPREENALGSFNRMACFCKADPRHFTTHKPLPNISTFLAPSKTQNPPPIVSLSANVIYRCGTRHQGHRQSECRAIKYLKVHNMESPGCKRPNIRGILVDL